MRRLVYLLAIAIGGTAVTSHDAIAASRPSSLAPAFSETGEMLLANRLRNRGFSFRVRASRYRRGGFSRGDCPTGAAPLMPIVAAEAEIVSRPVSLSSRAPAYLTASAHPTFFIHVPALTNASGVLYLEDPNSLARNPQLFEATFDLPEESGIVGIQLPAAAPALEEGKTYRWRVTITCGEETTDIQENAIVLRGGVVERVADIESTPEQKLDYYLESGIWQETVEILATDRYQNPSATADQEWATLMEASGIPEFAETPIVGIVESQLVTE